MTDRDEVVLVTTAARSRAEERRDRERRYLITMGIRVIAFVVAIVVTRGWIRVIAVTLALVLPWVAVVAANAPRRAGREAPSLYQRRTPREITEHTHDSGRGSMSA